MWYCKYAVLVKSEVLGKNEVLVKLRVFRKKVHALEKIQFQKKMRFFNDIITTIVLEIHKFFGPAKRWFKGVH